MSASLIDRFGDEYVKYNGISLERARQQRTLLLEFVRTLDGRGIQEATYEDLQRFAGQLVARGLHVNTVRKKLNQIRPFYSWAYAAGVVTPEQYLSLRQVKDPSGSSANGIPDPYTRAELTAMWARLDERWPRLPTSGRGSNYIRRWEAGTSAWGRVYRHAMRLQLDALVRLALDCGLRRAEIFRLELNDLHYDNEYLVVWRAAKGKGKGIRVKQSLPMTTEVRQALYSWLEFRAKMGPDHERPWLSCYADARNHPMWWTRFQTLLQDTVGPEWRWHRLRHTCATEWLRAGMELENVSRLLGHANLQQTLCYAEIVKGDLMKHVNRHEGAFNRAVSPEEGRNAA